MTEQGYREMFAWIDRHRGTLIEQAGGIAEMAEWATRAPTGAEHIVLRRIGRRCERFAVELGIALESLQRFRPDENEETQPRIVP